MDPHALDVLEWSAVRRFVIDRCLGPMGRRVAEQLVPDNDARPILLALAQTSELRALLDAGQSLPLNSLVDPARLFAASSSEGRSFEPRELAGTLAVLRRTKDVTTCVERHRAILPETTKLVEQFLDVSDLVTMIEDVVEPPDALRRDASPRLAELHRELDTIKNDIQQQLARLQEKTEVRNALQAPGYTIRNGRWVLAVKLDMKGRVRGIVHDESQSGATVFIEPSVIVPLANRLREVESRITAEASRVLWELTRGLREHKNRILHTANILAWLDFTQAKAAYSKDYGMHAAEHAPDGVLRLFNARHPLLVAAAAEMGEQVVPLDIRLREGFRILVVTGPNTGGKTVTLKTVGLLQLMHQAGMHVPVEPGTRMPIFAGIHADIGDEQSITQSLSTFSGHISNIARILKKSGKRSLVLLDELGAGTDPAEGAALGRSILECLRQKRASAVVTTHLGSLKEFAYQHADVENASVAFDQESMRPTYQLLIGQPGNSNALLIAGRYGLDDEILDRARVELEAQTERPEHEMIQKLQESRQELEARRAESERQLRRSRNLARSAEEKQRHLEKKSKRIRGEAEGVIDQVLKELRQELDPHLRRLANAPKALQSDVAQIEAILAAKSRGSALADRRRAFIATLKKQDEVYVPRFGQKCRIRKFHRADEKLTVMVGTMPMEISYEDVGLPDASPTE